MSYNDDGPEWVNGLSFYEASDRAPEYILGNIVIDDRIFTWLQEQFQSGRNLQQGDHGPRLRLSVKRSRKGSTYVQVDDPSWKEKRQPQGGYNQQQGNYGGPPQQQGFNPYSPNGQTPPVNQGPGQQFPAGPPPQQEAPWKRDGWNSGD